jgi:hypothetical protein
MVLVLMAGFWAIPTGILGAFLGFAWACSGDRSPGDRARLTLAAGIGGAALGAVAVFCFIAAKL